MFLFYSLYQFEGTDLVALRPDEGCLPFQTLSTHGCNSTAGGYFADVRDHIIYGGIILYTISKVLTWEYWNADQLLRATMPQLTEITSSFESIGKCYLPYVGGVLKEGERGGGSDILRVGTIHLAIINVNLYFTLLRSHCTLESERQTAAVQVPDRANHSRQE